MCGKKFQIEHFWAKKRMKKGCLCNVEITDNPEITTDNPEITTVSTKNEPTIVFELLTL